MTHATEQADAHGYADDRDDMDVPAGVDPTVPSPARMYDYYLGGKTNCAADRAAAKKALSVVPSGRRIAQANRYFMMRAVLLMADQGIRQFVDLGSGLPTSPSVDELAQAVQPDAEVLYVDNDPVVTANSRILLAKRKNVEVLQADIRQPGTILSSAELRRMIDFNEPVGVLFVAVLHFVRDKESPGDIIHAFTERIAAGSYLALSHITSDGTDHAVMATVRDAYAHASAPAIFRSADEISDFFSGFELQEPGLTDVTHWFPYSAVFAAHPPALKFLAGVGRKSMLPGSDASSCHALEELAAILNPRDHVTTLITGEDRQPHLTVGSRYAPLTKDVYVGMGFYWCGSGEEVAPMSDPAAAAHKVSKCLFMESRRIIWQR